MFNCGRELQGASVQLVPDTLFRRNCSGGGCHTLNRTLRKFEIINSSNGSVTKHSKIVKVGSIVVHGATIIISLCGIVRVKTSDRWG
jgi:hypothetical protein